MIITKRTCCRIAIIANGMHSESQGMHMPTNALNQVSEALLLHTLLFFLPVELRVESLQVHLHHVAHHDRKARA